MKTGQKIEVLERNEFINIMEKCFAKLNIITPVFLENAEMTPEQLDFCRDSAINAFHEFGFNWEKDEPNAFGLELKKAVTTLQIKRG